MIIVDIPDMHGSHAWEDVKNIAKEHPDYYFISHGDWFDGGRWDYKIKRIVSDNKWPDQGENFKNFMEWTKEDPEHRFCLMGNHDWQYLTCNREASCSGNQYQHASEIRSLLNLYKDYILIAKEFDGWVFSHAGFTKNWVHDFIHEMHNEYDEWPNDETGEPGKVWDESEFSIDFINKVFKEHTHIYGDDTCNSMFDELFDWRGFFSPTGDEVCQGPLWVRPYSLLKEAYFPNQVVGHTSYCIDEPIRLFMKNNKVCITDTESKDMIYILDTENPKEYITWADFERRMKKLEQKVNIIKSQKITDINEIKNRLGVKNISRYINKFFPELAE